MQASMASELNYVSLQSTSTCNRKVMNPKIVTEFGTRHMDRHVCHFGTMHACVPKMHSHYVEPLIRQLFTIIILSTN